MADRDYRDYITQIDPSRLRPGPSGIMGLIGRPGVRDAMLATGMALLAQKDQRGSFGGALGRALPYGVQAFERGKREDEYEQFLEGTPSTMQAVLRMLGPERGLPFLAQQMSAGPPEPVALGADERLVDPVTGEIRVDAMPEPADRDIRTVGGALLEVTDTGVNTLYETPEEGPDFNDVAALRNRFAADTKPYEDAAQAFRKLEASATGEATPAKDIALVFNYMKAIDPASSVREGEFATAQNAGSAWTIAGNLYNRLLTGQRLNETQRAEFLNSAKEQLASLLPQYQSVADQYRQIAESNRFDVGQVIRNPFSGLNLAPAQAMADPLGIR